MEPAKWYPALHRVNMMKEKEVAVQISDETTLNPKEAEMALAQFKKCLFVHFWTDKVCSWATGEHFILLLEARGTKMSPTLLLLRWKR